MLGAVTFGRHQLVHCRRHAMHLRDFLLGQVRGQHQGHDGGELDQDVHGRTAGILERVTYRVAGNRCLVCVATLLVHHAVDQHSLFEALLGIVPCATSVVLEHTHEHTAHRDTGQQATQCFRPHEEAYDHG